MHGPGDAIFFNSKLVFDENKLGTWNIWDYIYSTRIEHFRKWQEHDMH